MWYGRCFGTTCIRNLKRNESRALRRKIMKSVEERIANKIEENDDGVLMKFLGAKNVERLKKEVTDAIIQQVIKDLHDSCDYIISPDDIVQDIIDDIMDSAKKNILPKVEKMLYKKTMAKLGLEE